MTKGFLVRLPMGMGKTRIVWKEILERATPRPGSWNRLLRKTVVLGPNDHAERAWLRELVLHAVGRGVIRLSETEEQIRGMRNRRLRRLLREACIHPPTFLTYRKMQDRRHKRCRFLILDEWHQLPRRVRSLCEVYLEGAASAQWFLGGQGVTRTVFFVSATPLNPVLEQEDSRDGEPELTLPQFAARCTRARREAIAVVRAFLGQRKLREKSTGGGNDTAFSKAVRALGVQELPRYSRKKWPLPRAFDFASGHHDEQEWRLREIQATRRYLEHSDEPWGMWSEEYAYAVGLVRTRARRRRPHRVVYSRKASQKCFGFPYNQLFTPEKHGRADACEWLWMQHTRIQRLLAVLKEANVLYQRKNGYLKPGRRKALIFCTHRGVAMGLTLALRSRLEESEGKAGLGSVATNVDPAGAKRRGGGRRYVEDLIDGFSRRSRPPHILIATDVLSESLDLHEACRHLIHYELPWSPLRLFQRIGRLTRLKTWGNRLVFNRNVQVAHIILPGSVEEERVNRLMRRIKYLEHEGIWPEGYTLHHLMEGLIGGGPSLHFQEMIGGRMSSLGKSLVSQR